MRANTLFFFFFGFCLLSNVFLSCQAQGSRDSYDFIVVGSGTAGSVVAGELAENCRSCSILLIEAGGDATDPKITNSKQQTPIAFFPAFSYLRDDFTSQPMTGFFNRRIFNVRGRMLGGSFGVNAMFHVVGDPTDWDLTAAQIGDNNWSFRKTDKYRRRLTREFDIFQYDNTYAGFQQYVDSAAALGLAFDSNIENGINGIAPGAQIGTFNPNRPGTGLRQTSFNIKIERANVDNVEIITFHQVSKVLIDANKIAYGVEVINTRSNEVLTFNATREVILSAGAFRTPQILMLSGIGPQAHLQSFGIPVVQDLPAVGSNLEDHLGLQTFWENKVVGTTAPFLFSAPSFNIFGPEASGRPSYQLEISPGFVSIAPMALSAGGTVRLNSTNPLEQPLVTYDITSEWEDAVLHGVKTILFPFIDELRERNVFGFGFTPTQPGASDETIRNDIRARLETNYHPTGTARVGPANDPNAVVDSHFRVRGVQNLRVVDASVFRFEPIGNINSPTMVLGYLAADIIARDNNV